MFTVRKIRIKCSARGVFVLPENFELQKASNLKPVERDVPLQPIEIGKSVVLENIFFPIDEYSLETESEVDTKLKEYLDKNPTLKIEIGGHTDNQGGKEHNNFV